MSPNPEIGRFPPFLPEISNRCMHLSFSEKSNRKSGRDRRFGRSLPLAPSYTHSQSYRLVRVLSTYGPALALADSNMPCVLRSRTKEPHLRLHMRCLLHTSRSPLGFGFWVLELFGVPKSAITATSRSIALRSLLNIEGPARMRF